MVVTLVLGRDGEGKGECYLLSLISHNPLLPVNIPKPKAEMASEVQLRLAFYLNMMKQEELKEFLRRVSEKEVSGHLPTETLIQPEKAGGTEVASHLVAQFGEQQAWELTLHTWDQMGLSRMRAQAQAEAAFMSSE